MNHESREADQKGQEDAGASTGADPSRRRPSGEETRDESTSAARASSDGVEAYRGYRLWRLAAGQLQSHRNDTVWPTGHALTAKAHLGTEYWKHKTSSLAGSLAVSVVGVTVGCAAVLPLYELTALLLEGPPLLPKGVVFLSVWALLLVLHVAVCIRRSPLFPVIKARLMGQVVVPGSNTPGIYAMRWPSDVQDWDSPAKPGHVLVRGTVWLWGDTIEHEYGMKGEFAYPGVITDVRCVGCQGWVPIEEYGDETEPPLDARCRADGFTVEKWKPAGLWRLRAEAPHWFEPAA